jgi:N-acetylmuramoyl-L-alanine amidase
MDMKTRTPLQRGVLVGAIALVSALASAPAQAASLKVGDCSSAVRSLQQKLASARYPTGAIDGCFGRATRHAVLAVQLAHGLAADGIAGPQTQAALRAPRAIEARSRPPGRHVEVDRRRQLLVLVRDGVVTAIYAASTGKAGYRTPAGTYRVYRKQAADWSYRYQVLLPWVSYFLRGYAVHAGRIPGYPASHGCVRVPPPFAEAIYRRMAVGSSVVIY